MVGTRVRERMKDASMAKATASAMGMNSQPETPLSSNSGNQTMTMARVATKVGITIWLAASMMATSSGLPISMWVSMFSIITVASSTRMPTASASPPRVMTLMDSPIQCRQMMEDRMDSGIDVAMMVVARQDPRNSSTTRPVSADASTISCSTSLMESFTKVEASLRIFTPTPGGTILRMRGIAFLIPSTTAKVEASPLFITTIITACLPSTSTELV